MSLPYDSTTACTVLCENDPDLGILIERVGPLDLELRHEYSPFQAILRSIVYQQLSGKAAATIYGRVCALFPDTDHPTPAAIATVPVDTLRGAGLSRAKTRAAKDLAAKTLDGTIPSREMLEAMDDAAIIKRLTAVWGVGRWTAEMLLIFYLGRPDVLPVNDLGVQKGLMLTYGLDALPSPDELAAYGERWRPYRSVASWYLWRAVDQMGT